MSERFLTSGALSAVSAIFSLASTVVIVRFLGDAVFSEFTVDLSILAIVLLLLEIGPASYFTFRIQEGRGGVGLLVVQLALSTVLGIAAVLIISAITTSFHSYSIWVCGFVITSAVKRFLDIFLQAHGRLESYLITECVGAILRLVVMFALLGFGMAIGREVWVSLVVGMAISQMWTLTRNPLEFSVTAMLVDKKLWVEFFLETRLMRPYYANVAFKRVKDSLPVLLADRFLPNASETARFFLAMRGVSVIVGQFRLLEGILNHRGTLSASTAVGLKSRVQLALIGQSGCMLGSALILVLSGVPDVPWLMLVILSLLIWPIGFMLPLRARAFSQFNANAVTLSVVAAMISFVVGGAISGRFFSYEAEAFSVSLVLSEIIGFLSLRYLMK